MLNGIPLFTAQCIGASFIIISGMSARLARFSYNFRSRFFKRICVLILICFLISSITFFLDKTSFIFFGIIHFLATCSIVSLLFIRIKNNNFFFILFAISLVLSLSKLTYELPIYLSWLGFNVEVPKTNDFYPLFPWICFYFFGLWISEPVTNYIKFKDKSSRITRHKFARVYKGLIFVGRNSLTIYIIHQPIFFSLFLIFIRISS